MWLRSARRAQSSLEEEDYDEQDYEKTVELLETGTQSVCSHIVNMGPTAMLLAPFRIAATARGRSSHNEQMEPKRVRVGASTSCALLNWV